MLMPVLADRGQVWVSPSVSSGRAAWHSAPPSVIHRKSLTPASVSPFVMSKSVSALWQRTGTEHNVFSLCEGPWQPSTPMSRGAREEAVLLRTSSSGCQIFPPPFGKPVPCTMLICHSKWLTWLLLLYERLFFFDCLFFCWFYFAPVLQRKAKSAWISRVTICRMTAAFYHMFIAYMACGGAGEVLHDGIWGGSSVV